MPELSTTLPREPAEEAPRAVPFWVVRRLQPGLQIRKEGHFWRHGTKQSAIDEARRLAARFPGNRFVVLEAIHIEGELKPTSSETAKAQLTPSASQAIHSSGTDTERNTDAQD